MTRGILGRALLCAGLLAVWALPAHAQAIGSIFGKVTDASGAVLPGVNVSVAGTGLQTPLTSTTTESGAYQFPSVPIGTYSVSFELQGCSGDRIDVAAAYPVEQAVKFGFVHGVLMMRNRYRRPAVEAAIVAPSSCTAALTRRTR